MLKTVSATPLRAPGTPCSSGAPADPNETVTPEEHPTPLARTAFALRRLPHPLDRKNTLVIEPAEAELVREMFRQYLAGSGAKSTARNMNQRGLLYRKHLWTRDLVLRVISDPGVIGTYNWGRLDSSGKCIRPESEWIPMAVERIVDDEIFQMVQELRSRRDPGRNSGRLPSSPLFLAGLLRCSRCGDPASSKARASSIRTANPIATTIAAASVGAVRKLAPATESRSTRWIVRS
jgi:Recombinase